MSDPVGGREAEIEAALDRIEWYVQCLRDAWLGHAVRGMDEARAGYDSALDALRSSGSAAQNQECPLHGDEAHPDWQDYVATNLLDALSLVPNTGDWWGALKGWAERHSSGRLDPNRVPPSGSAAQNQEEPRVERIARAFHETYERIAPLYGYQTRESSAVPWEDVPEQNKVLMRATVGNLLTNGIIQAARSPQDEEMDHAWLLRNAPQGLPAPVGDREGAIREVVAFLRSRAPVAQPRHGADHAFTRLRPRMGSTVMTTYSQGYYSVPEDEYERLLIARARLEEIEKIFNAGYLSRLPGEGAASLKGPALARLRGLIHDHEEHT